MKKTVGVPKRKKGRKKEDERKRGKKKSAIEVVVGNATGDIGQEMHAGKGMGIGTLYNWKCHEQLVTIPHGNSLKFYYLKIKKLVKE